MFRLDGLTGAAWLASGGATSGAGPASLALGIINNGSTFDKGIVFHDEALRDLGSGLGEAISFGLYHAIFGYNASGDVTSRLIFNTATQASGQAIIFDNNGIRITKQDQSDERARFNEFGLWLGGASLSSPTGIGRLRFTQVGGGMSGLGGIEFLAATFGAGYGWKIDAYDEGGSTPMVVMARANSTTWYEHSRFVNEGGFKPPSYAADPAVGNGQIYYNTTTNKLRGCEGGAWANLI